MVEITSAMRERIVELSRLGDACWPWPGHIDKDGYGRGTRGLAHRVVYSAVVGAIPKGLELDHLCRNRRCVNPDHLEPVTHAENTQRALIGRLGLDAEYGRRCRHGHEYTPENTYYWRGRRDCRTCRANAQVRRRERRVAGR